MSAPGPDGVVCGWGCDAWSIHSDCPQHGLGTPTWTGKPKVTKLKLWPSDIAEPWMVLNHPLPRRFATWREAMDYALTRPVPTDRRRMQQLAIEQLGPEKARQSGYLRAPE